MNEKFMQNTFDLIKKTLEESWKKITPSWPLENIIAVNPLSGFQDLHFQKALEVGNLYFRQKNMPCALQNVNRQTIKWLQLFFDERQATIKMPLKDKGLLKSVYQLIQFDSNIINKDNHTFYTSIEKQIDTDPLLVIQSCLEFLNISEADYNQYCTIILTTLPGWASYIQHQASYSKQLCAEYTALRLLLICLLYPNGKDLINTYRSTIDTQEEADQIVQKINQFEQAYQKNLFEKLQHAQLLTAPENHLTTNVKKDAQLVFCIDVRSEGIRKTIESLGNYQTFGFAGFFGLPVQIDDKNTTTQYAACPVLLRPEYTVTLSKPQEQTSQSLLQSLPFIKIYQALKYNIVTSFGLAESTGLICGIVILLKTFFPKLLYYLKSKIYDAKINFEKTVSFETIPFEKQCSYALQALQSIGLTNNFADFIFFVGHASQTENNAYASALDCGACAGRSGGINAFIIASILNKQEIHAYLATQNIIIPDSTYCIGAEHITTTDTIIINTHNIPADELKKFEKIIQVFKQAQTKYTKIRLKDLNIAYDTKSNTEEKSQDWAEIRPEWGLANNASFIIAPRELTENISLDGRSFLHSYDWKLDSDGTILRGILHGPMIVGQWINAQYLFSTLDNTAFGAGSKITHNITGKIGVMQGNGSDLMNGLPLQSVYATDTQPYHQPTRLLVIIYAPLELVHQIVSQPTLQTLIKHEWIHLTCINPSDQKFYKLTADLQWQL